MSGRVVLAYSGGLDTSVAIKWLAQEYGMEVVAVTVDVGNERDFTVIKQKALDVGAEKAIVVDAKSRFVNEFVFTALKADAVYQGQYPLATALSRPLIASILVDVAVVEGARAVAHGCTGKGNDQVRIEVGVNALAPDLTIIAPAREWGMTREETIKYAQEHGIPVPVTKKSPYSIDENLWGRSIECGVLEDPWNEPPDDVWGWTKGGGLKISEPDYIELGFYQGTPVALDGKEIGGVDLLLKLNELAGKHAIGRIDHVEDRRVGIKSRELYEAPAATVLLGAHRALESLCLSRDQLRFKRGVAGEYADLVYDGLWFTAHRENLAAYIENTQRFVTGTVRVKLFKGSATVVGRKSPFSLYDYGLATYDKGDNFDQSASAGFIHIWGLPSRTQTRAQTGREDIPPAGAKNPRG
ncbi:MAG: argininosuccinate synthase [Dehalococcoidia bacterium]|jgi:argininosuccinate synthase|nr:MAG: argininosuccinate synthase [Dehalococcoidia bacterium]